MKPFRAHALVEGGQQIRSAVTDKPGKAAHGLACTLRIWKDPVLALVEEGLPLTQADGINGADKTPFAGTIRAHVSNGATEAANNLIKLVKRIAFGFTSFRNYRIRSLLYAGQPDWNLLATVAPTSP